MRVLCETIVSLKGETIKGNGNEVILPCLERLLGKKEVVSAEEGRVKSFK